MPRKSKTTDAFPPACCGACFYAHTDSDNDLICYVEPGSKLPDGLGSTVSVRGVVVNIQDPPCMYFKQRENA
jgi:hypothetical protein